MKLHLGCGKRFIPGWTHVDGLKFDHVDYVSKLDTLDFLASESVDIIYASHVLEHFKREEVESVLLEWKRVLKVGGILRLSVPDFAQLIKIYQVTGDLAVIRGPLYGGQDHDYNFHFNTFDLNSLSILLEFVGFSSVTEWDWRTTEHKAIDDFSQAFYPHMDKDNGIQVSLNLEAVKINS